MTTLEDFVSETLTQIVNGMTKVAKEQKSADWSPIPRLSDQTVRGAQGFLTTLGNGTAITVEFDVAVSAGESSEGGSKGGANILHVVNFELGGKLEATNTTISRVKFPVALQMPGFIKEAD